MRLKRLTYLCLSVLASSMAMGQFATTAALATTSSCPEMNDRHFGLHISPKGSEAIFQTIGEYAQTALHWYSSSTTRPIQANFPSMPLVPVSLEVGGNSEVKQILSQLYSIGFFVNLDLSKKITLYMDFPQTQLGFKLNNSESRLTIMSSNSEEINFSIALALENLELKFPKVEICKDTYIQKDKVTNAETRKCTGRTNIKANTVGLRVAPKKYVKLVLKGKIDLREGKNNLISIISSNLELPTGSIKAISKTDIWDKTQSFSDPAVGFNLFIDPKIDADLDFIISGDGIDGTTTYPFDDEMAVKLVSKFLIANHKHLFSVVIPKVEGLVDSVIQNYLSKSGLKAQLKYQLTRGDIEKSVETLMASSDELIENECIESPPGDKGMAVYQFLAQMISGVSVKSKLARVTNGSGGGQSLFFDNQYLLLTNQDNDQSLEQDHFIPEYAPTAENNCIADPQILLPEVQTHSGLPTPENYHFALNTSEKTWNAVLANLSSSGIIQGLLQNFTSDSSISLSLPKVRFKRLLEVPDPRFVYLGTIYVQTSLWIDFSTVVSNSSDNIKDNLVNTLTFNNFSYFSTETYKSYLSYWGGQAERLMGSGKVGVVPLEIRLDLYTENKTGKIVINPHSLFDNNGYFRNALGQFSNQEKILGPVLSSIKSKFTQLEEQLNQSHYLETDMLEQWLWGSLGAQLELTSLNATKGGQLIAFFKLHHFDASILSTCKVGGI